MPALSRLRGETNPTDYQLPLKCLRSAFSRGLFSRLLALKPTINTPISSTESREEANPSTLLWWRYKKGGGARPRRRRTYKEGLPATTSGASQLGPRVLSFFGPSCTIPWSEVWRILGRSSQFLPEMVLHPQKVDQCWRNLFGTECRNGSMHAAETGRPVAQCTCAPPPPGKMIFLFPACACTPATRSSGSLVRMHGAKTS